MKQLTFSRRQILRTIRTTCLALFFAACAGHAGADPSASPEFNINGSNVTVLGTANNPTTAFFVDPSPNTYAITIQSGATIGNTGGNLLTFNSGSVTTAGTLTASNYAIWIQNAGSTISSTVTNTGSISSTSFAAVYFAGNGTVNNTDGSIVNTSGAGLYLVGSATVNNSGTGTIQGLSNAINIQGNAVVSNQGTITAQDLSAVFILGAGNVTNSGTITADTKSGVYIAGVGNVTNSGIITGSHSGVYINNNGTVTNSGTITGQNWDGVAIFDPRSAAGTGVVNNSGTIIGGNTAGPTTGRYSGVYFFSSGTVNNSSTGTISGYYGVSSEGGTVNNSGVITGTQVGVYFYTGTNVSTGPEILSNNGTVNNTGTISGNYGIKITDTGVVNNSGTITGNTTSGVGIQMGSGTVNNSSTGTISGYYGVKVTGTGTVNNSGAITGTNGGYAVQMNSGTVNNASTGTISGDYYGVRITGTGTVNNAGTISGYYGVRITGTGTVNNAGTITGTNGGYAIQMDSGTVNNASTGTISGYYGVRFAGTGTVNNAGTITGDANNGVGIQLASGTVNNASTGTISGYYGVRIAGTGTVINAGTITGTNGGYGVQLDSGTVNNSGTISGYNGVRIIGTGTVNNIPTGTISGYNGVVTEGANDSVLNSGTISGSDIGVLINGDNSSLLTRGGEISGGSDSVLIMGENNTVTVKGRTDILGTINGDLVANNNALHLNVVGMTPAQAAAANALNGQSSGTIVAGLGASQYTYNWANFAGVTVHAISLEQAVDSGLTEVATRIDDGQLPRGFDAFYAGASSNPEAALNSLVGREFNDAVGTINLNNSTALGEIFDSRALDLRSGTGGFDLSGLSVSSGSLLASLGQTNNMLDRMMGNALLSGTSISDSTQETGQTDNSHRWGVWAAGTVTLADQSNTGNTPGYNATTGSPTLGVDFKVSHNLALGVLANYSTTGADFSDGSNLNVQTGLGALYGTWADGPWYVNALAGGGYSSYDNHRTVPAGNPGSAHSSPDGNQINANVTGGHDFKMGKMVLSPEVGVLYTHVTENSYSETGEGIYDLSQAQQNIDSLRTKVGFHVTENIDWEGLKFTPQVRAAWYHECLDDSRGVSTSIAGAPALGSFVVQTNSQGRDFAILGLGLAASPTKHDNVTFFLNYDVQVGQDNYIANTFNGGIRYDF